MAWSICLSLASFTGARGFAKTTCRELFVSGNGGVYELSIGSTHQSQWGGRIAKKQLLVSRKKNMPMLMMRPWEWFYRHRTAVLQHANENYKPAYFNEQKLAAEIYSDPHLYQEAQELEHKQTQLKAELRLIDQQIAELRADVLGLTAQDPSLDAAGESRWTKLTVLAQRITLLESDRAVVRERLEPVRTRLSEVRFQEQKRVLRELAKLEHEVPHLPEQIKEKVQEGMVADFRAQALRAAYIRNWVSRPGEIWVELPVLNHGQIERQLKKYTQVDYLRRDWRLARKAQTEIFGHWLSWGLNRRGEIGQLELREAELAGEMEVWIWRLEAHDRQGFLTADQRQTLARLRDLQPHPGSWARYHMIRKIYLEERRQRINGAQNTSFIGRARGVWESEGAKRVEDIVGVLGLGSVPKMGFLRKRLFGIFTAPLVTAASFLTLSPVFSVIDHHAIQPLGRGMERVTHFLEGLWYEYLEDEPILLSIAKGSQEHFVAERAAYITKYYPDLLRKLRVGDPIETPQLEALAGRLVRLEIMRQQHLEQEKKDAVRSQESQEEIRAEQEIANRVADTFLKKEIALLETAKIEDPLEFKERATASLLEFLAQPTSEQRQAVSDLLEGLALGQDIEIEKWQSLLPAPVLAALIRLIESREEVQDLRLSGENLDVQNEKFLALLRRNFTRQIEEYALVLAVEEVRSSDP